ncbi:hypothetical protein TNCT6_57530 [Streptomyces sp. 6-11-2]|nr:hypothetical protein TNCT6_57530 [Streptomyces sp. 6-11-2]
MWIADGAGRVPAGLLKQGEHGLDVCVARNVAHMHRSVHGRGGGQQWQRRVLGPVDTNGTGKRAAGPDGDYFCCDWGNPYGCQQSTPLQGRAL